MGRRRNAAAAALIAVPTVLLAALSLLSASAAFTALPADAVLERARVGARPSGEALRGAAETNLRAARFFESARYRTAAASAAIAANRAGAPIPDGRAEHMIRQALAASPASPFNWSRLAWLRYRAKDGAGAAAAWQMSILTGRYKPPVMLSRIDLGLRLLRLGRDAALESALRDQILVAARTDPAGLAAYASTAGVQPAVRAAVAGDRQASAGYEAANKQVVADTLRQMRKPHP